PHLYISSFTSPHPTPIYTLSLHDALPIFLASVQLTAQSSNNEQVDVQPFTYPIEICSACAVWCNSKLTAEHLTQQDLGGNKCDEDRKSTRLNSSHRTISYAVFCLKKKKIK